MMHALAKLIYDVVVFLSLGFFIASLLLWAGDRSVTLFHWPDTAETFQDVKWKGSIAISRITKYSTPIHYGSGSDPKIWDSWKTEHPDIHQSVAGFAWSVTTQVNRGGDRSLVNDSKTRLFIIPLWFVLLSTAILPIRCIRLTQRRRRHTEGLCDVCGQDVRASTVLCPQCGAPIRRLKVTHARRRKMTDR